MGFFFVLVVGTVALFSMRCDAMRCAFARNRGMLMESMCDITPDLALLSSVVSLQVYTHDLLATNEGLVRLATCVLIGCSLDAVFIYIASFARYAS